MEINLSWILIFVIPLFPPARGQPVPEQADFEDDGFVFYFNAPELERGREEIKRLEVNAGRRKNGEELTAVKSTTADELSKETTKPTGKEVEAKRRVVLKGPPLLKYEDIPEVPFESHELPLFEDLGLGPRDGGESDERGYFRGAKFIPFDTLPTVQKDHGFVPMVRRIHSNTTTPDAYQCKECLVVGELAFDNLNGTFDKITSRDFFFAVDGYMNDFVDTVISHPEDYVQLGDLHQVGSTIYLNFTFTYGHVYTSAREERLQKVFNEYTTNSTALAQADLHILPEQSMLMVERNESLRWDPTNEIRPDPFGLMESGVENFHVHWIVDMIFLLLGFTSPIFVITGFKHQRQKLRFKRYALKEAKRMEIYHQQRQRFNRSVINQRIGLYGHLKTRLEPAKWVRVDIGAKRLVVGGQAVISGSGLDRKPIEFPNSIRDTETELMAEKVKKMELAPQCPSLKKVDHQDIPRLRRLREIRNNQVMPQRKDSAQRDQSTLDLTKNDQNKTKKADQCNQTILAEQSKAKRDASEVKKANRCEQTILSDPSTSTKDQVEVKKADPLVVTKDRAETEVAHRSDATVCAATKTPKGSNKADQLVKTLVVERSSGKNELAGDESKADGAASPKKQVTWCDLSGSKSDKATFQWGQAQEIKAGATCSTITTHSQMIETVKVKRGAICPAARALPSVIEMLEIKAHNYEVSPLKVSSSVNKNTSEESQWQREYHVSRGAKTKYAYLNEIYAGKLGKTTESVIHVDIPFVCLPTDWSELKNLKKT